MSNPLFIISLVLVALAAACSAQSYSYEFTVQLGYKKFEPVSGQLSAYLQDASGDYSHKVMLSYDNETFSTGVTKKYYFNAPFPIEHVDQVVLEWTGKSAQSEGNSIWVDIVLVDPSYVTDWNVRQQSIRPFWTAERPQRVVKDTQVAFSISS
ncbi:hypothetical protein HDE_04372 [Halotydeus destructor]|nr:hypothetical protein HDE_04372 [Halotydeus destructor]